MDVIRLLPDSVANQIAAGEVIQRPASCLKELVENSLDAGATRIQIIVRDAGRTLLQVIDNGQGMSETDARMAFERHATSKIREAADLFNLRTMGFRGEALPSICAVAQVEVLTRRAEDEVGTLLEIHGSQVVRQEPATCPVGTNMKVKNLFFNIPVRRKFLKTDQTELRNLLSEFYRIVLVWPQVQFTFVHNDEIMHELPEASFKQRIEQVFGKPGKPTFTLNLVDIHTETELVTIRGLVGKPEAAGRGARQYFFVNGRFMRHPYFHKAVMTAYTNLLTGDQEPSYFICMEVNPENIDVNIHPTKTEIKFQDEQPIFQILLATVREALGKFNVAPSLDFDREGYVEMPTPNASSTYRPANRLPIQVDTSYNPFTRTHERPVAAPANWQSLYEPQLPQEEKDKPTIPSDIYQYHGRYLLVPSSEGLMFVDQHRAHTHVLYKTYIDQLSHGQAPVQQLLFPEVLDLSADDMLLFATIAEDLRHIGFDIEQLGPRQYSISGVPSLLSGQDPISTLQHILSSVRETGTTATDVWRRRIALALAADTAIPYGKTLTPAEKEDLISQLFHQSDYRYTEDGKTIISVLTDEELEGKF